MPILKISYLVVVLDVLGYRFPHAIQHMVRRLARGGGIGQGYVGDGMIPAQRRASGLGVVSR